MTDKELLQQALDALENHAMQRTYAGGVVIANAAIALRERLARPFLTDLCRCGKESVAWCMANSCHKAGLAQQERCHHGVWAADHCYACEREPARQEPWEQFYPDMGKPTQQFATATQTDGETKLDANQRQEQEPVASGFAASIAHQALPRRQWQGLTEEDLSVCDGDGKVLARYWEAKLREKNE